MALIKVKTSRSGNILVCEVKSRSVADLLVYVSDSRTVARGVDERWCYVDSQTASSSTICWVQSRSVADLLVCFVTSRSVAGWQGTHRLQGQL